MNIFVLSTGRCGSSTFIKSCKHIKNYTASHESRAGMIGDEHFQYPDNHIEADNRLCWFLGRLERTYGDKALYVHLRRSDIETAHSITKRYERGIIRAYRESILMRLSVDKEPMAVALDYCDTVNSNIEYFLRDKNDVMHVSLENAKEKFQCFWQRISAEGDLSAALSEWDIAYNATGEKPKTMGGVIGKASRIVHGLPEFLRSA